MATRFFECPHCQIQLSYSDTQGFKINCSNCGTGIESPDGIDVYYDPTAKRRKTKKRRSYKRIATDIALQALICVGVGILILVTGLAINSIRDATAEKSDTAKSSQLSSVPIPSYSANSNPSSAPLTAEVGMSIYSGSCIFYKKELEGTTLHLKPISTGFAKVVMNRASKSFYFYYNGKLVFQYTGYSSYLDKREGGVGFTFDSDADAHRFTAERVFQLNTERVMDNLGYQYEITNYKEN